jgi:DegV family protein with EDD domain
MKIITDTGSLITQERAKQLNITLLPLQVAIDGKNYRDYFELSAHDFIPMTRKSIPVSSQPALGEVMEAYEDSQETLHITMTRGLSATYDSAFGHIQSSGVKHVTLFNSMTLAGNEQYLVELAVKLREDNTIPEIVERMKYCLKECQSFLMPEDFDFLKRGGRLSPLAATLSGFMRIRPIVIQTEGSLNLEKFGVGRNWKSAIKHIVQKMIENGVSEKHKIYISHAENEDVASIAYNQIKEKIHNADIVVLPLTPVMITQGGPGCVAIQYILKDPLVTI